ncbi:MAG: redox-sensing transcriptional repressor Rex [Lentisphaerae bacterium]|nr:redox-sensing transcriptional repressor Rex [Lentisphaerota bacterium]
MRNTQTPIPSSARRRLARYLTFLQELRARGVEWVSSQEIADSLGLTSSTVRQDMSHVDFSGISKRGYAVPGLERVLMATLGADVTWKCVVVGAGNLGAALARHEEFARRGFAIEGIFDNSPAKIGRKVGNLTVLPLREVPPFVGAHKTDIGVIAVPASAAQEVADMLIASGVKGLLNMALTHVIVPRSVAVMDSRIIVSLMELTHLVKYSH